MIKKKPVVSKAKPAPKRAIDDSKPLAEAVTPKAETVPHKGACKRSDCQHSDALHYGSANRWCNTSGCFCQAYQ